MEDKNEEPRVYSRWGGKGSICSPKRKANEEEETRSQAHSEGGEVQGKEDRKPNVENRSTWSDIEEGKPRNTYIVSTASSEEDGGSDTQKKESIGVEGATGEKRRYIGDE